MPSLAPSERLQPSLLDRLTDDAPHQTQESREARVLNLRQLREAVIRDLSWLLNTGALSQKQDLGEHPLVETSVLNYGLAHLAGSTVSGIDVEEVEKGVRDAIVRFEPRILKTSLKVRAVVTASEMSHNALAFDIEGELWAQPVPVHMLLRSEVDLETGSFTVGETNPGRPR